jgi:hypothetical protein
VLLGAFGTIGAAGCGAPKAPDAPEAPDDPVAPHAAAIEPEKKPKLDINPGDLFFGLQCRTEAQAQTVRLRNTGAGELSISSLRISGSGFSLEAPPALPAVIAPGDAVNVTVQFQPMSSKIKRFEGELQIRSNDPELRRAEVELGGMVQQPVLVASPRFLDFGERQAEAGCEVVEEIELRNLGRCPGDISSYRVRGSGGSSVSVRGLMAGTLDGEQGQRVQVVWNCERRRRTSAVLTFLDAERRAQAIVSLAGEAY